MLKRQINNIYFKINYLNIKIRFNKKQRNNNKYMIKECNN